MSIIIKLLLLVDVVKLAQENIIRPSLEGLLTRPFISSAQFLLALVCSTNWLLKNLVKYFQQDTYFNLICYVLAIIKDKIVLSSTKKLIKEQI